MLFGSDWLNVRDRTCGFEGKPTDLDPRALGLGDHRRRPTKKRPAARVCDSCRRISPPRVESFWTRATGEPPSDSPVWLAVADQWGTTRPRDVFSISSPHFLPAFSPHSPDRVLSACPKFASAPIVRRLHLIGGERRCAKGGGRTTKGLFSAQQVLAGTAVRWGTRTDGTWPPPRPIPNLAADANGHRRVVVTDGQTAITRIDSGETALHKAAAQRHHTHSFSSCQWGSTAADNGAEINEDGQLWMTHKRASVPGILFGP